MTTIQPYINVPFYFSESSGQIESGSNSVHTRLNESSSDRCTTALASTDSTSVGNVDGTNDITNQNESIDQSIDLNSTAFKSK